MLGRGWTYACWALLVLAVLTRNGLLFLAALTVLLAVGAARLWRRYCLDRVEYRRHLGQQRAFFGEEIDLVLEVVNRKPLPLPWLEIEDELPASLVPVTGGARHVARPDRSALVNLLSLRWYERVRRRYRLRCDARGDHVFGPVRMRSGDVFGLTSTEAVLEHRDRLLVYPRIVPIARLGLPAADPFGDQRTRAWIFQDPMRVVGVRDYAPGDTARRIHWKATARAQRLQVKINEPTTTRRLVIFLNLNTHGPAWWWQGYDPDLLELAISVAASVASWADEQGYQVGLSVNGYAERAGGRLRMPPSRDPEHLSRLLAGLARLLPFASMPLEGLIRGESRSLPHGATLVVVTAALGDEVVSALLGLRAVGHRVAILLIGDAAPRVSLSGIVIHRIGGQKDWRTLGRIDVPSAV